MAEETSKEPETEENRERKFSQEQYDMLKRCSDKKDMTEWNEWRKQNPNEDILLDEMNFHGCCLSGAFLNTGSVVINPGTSLHEQWIFYGQVYLRGSMFLQAKLCGTDFRGAHLEGAMFNFAELEGGCLELAHLNSARLLEANLQGAVFSGAKFQGADFSRAIVDGSTLIWTNEIDRKTKFEAVGLDSLRIYPATKQLLEYNIRRMNWEAWYEYKDWDTNYPKEKRKKSSRIIRQPVKWFWVLSDYGRSTGRIVFTFFGLAIIFTNIYYHWGRLIPPGIVENLFVDRNGVDIQWWLVPLRTLYFSIVTQTTLGFGDMYANAHNIWGHIFLSLQVILGYVLLGALITRFAVLFTAGGPAGKFADE